MYTQRDASRARRRTDDGDDGDDGHGAAARARRPRDGGAQRRARDDDARDDDDARTMWAIGRRSVRDSRRARWGGARGGASACVVDVVCGVCDGDADEYD